MQKILIIASSDCKLQADINSLIEKLSVEYKIFLALYPGLSGDIPVFKKNGVKIFGFEKSDKLNKLFIDEIKEKLLPEHDFKFIIIVSSELAAICLKELKLFYRTAAYVVFMKEKPQGRLPVLNYCDIILAGMDAADKNRMLKTLKSAVKNKTAEKKKLTSIIILTYNQLKHTKACIASLKKYTACRPYELIVVDNGSTDGTPKYLKSLKSIKLILNKSNLAFAKGCNQGIKTAKGDYILLLNNDTLLTEGWLDKMIECLESDKSIGLVGPRSNSAEFLQKAVLKKYKNDKDLQRFAQAFSMNYMGDYQETFWIIGFCMLMPREVVEQVGLLDERFGPGGYEDYDYCFRVGQAGYKIVIAGDVYIHHEGGKSSVHPEYEKFRRRNRGIFIEKWYKNILDFVESL